ncbi:hypothetical protein ABIF36_001078 [Bradyrhizobium japonicum]
MNQSVPNGSMKDSRYKRPTSRQLVSTAKAGALKPNWIVTQTT